MLRIHLALLGGLARSSWEIVGACGRHITGLRGEDVVKYSADGPERLERPRNKGVELVHAII